MRIIVLVLGFLIGVSSLAQEPQAKRLKMAMPQNQLQVFLYNPELRFERSNSQDLVDRKPINFAAALKFKEVSFLGEISQFEEKSGNTSSSLVRNHQDVILLFRNHFLESKAGAVTFSMYWGGGAGLYQDEVTSSLLGESRVDKSSPKLMGAISFGMDLAYSLSRNLEMIMAAEGRSLVASDFDPNPVWSALVRAGFLYRY